MRLIKMRISIKTIPNHPIWFLTYISVMWESKAHFQWLCWWILSCLEPATGSKFAVQRWAKCAALLYGLWGTSEPLCWKRRKAQVPTHYFAPFHIVRHSFLWPIWKTCYWGGLNNLSFSTLIIISSESWDILLQLLSWQESLATPQLE